MCYSVLGGFGLAGGATLVVFVCSLGEDVSLHEGGGGRVRRPRGVISCACVACVFCLLTPFCCCTFRVHSRWCGVVGVGVFECCFGFQAQMGITCFELIIDLV